MERRVVGTLINVAVHPHEGRDSYRRLFNDAYSTDRAIRVHGDRYAWMSHLWENEVGRRQFLTGHIATFTQIDVDGAWIDMATRSSADGQKISAIRRVVAGVQPNYHEFRFYVDLDCHLIAIEIHDGERSFSPRMAQRFFEGLFTQDAIAEAFGEVEVHFVPDREALNRIIGSKHLRKISIHVTRPNADSLNDVERMVMERLQGMDARSSSLTYSAIRGKTLELPEDVKTLARVAGSNGYVEGNVAGEDFSTKDHPIEKTRLFDDGAQSQEAAFNDLARDMISSERNP